MALNIGTFVDGTPFELPDDVLTHTIAILAKKGAGKTYTAGVIEEEMAERGMPFIVLDPVGVHYGIRSKANGKRSAYPIVVFGGEHGDVPIERTMGAQVAEAVVDENISCIIDLSELSKTAWRQFTRDFCRELYRRNRNTTPRHVFIEEATEFIPQTRRPEMQEVYEAVERLVRMGRNRGLGVTIISQRAATVAKDVLTQLDTLIALRTVGPQDRKAMLDMFEGVLEQDDLPTLELFKSEIARLPDGCAYVWSPEKMKCFETINIRERTTFHGGATAQVGEVQLVQAKPDVSALRKRLAPPPEQKDVPAKQKGRQQGACDHQQEIDTLHTEAARISGKLEEQAEEITQQAHEITGLSADATAFRQIRELLIPPPVYQYTNDGEGNERVDQIAPAVDEEALIQKILARVQVNGQAPQVTPPEALRKKYLNEAVTRTYEKIAAVGDKPRRAMEVLLSNPIYWSVSALTKAVGSGTGGQQIQNWREALKGLLALGLVTIGGKGRSEYKADVEGFARAELSVHSATDQEVGLVVQHVLAKVATT